MSLTEWTDDAFARLEVIVREQEAARAWLDHIERTWSAQREEMMAKIAALSAEYDELYAALDTYAHVESQSCELAPPPPWGVTPALPTAFDGPPVQWDPIAAPPSVEPRSRSRASVAAIVVVITVLALGLGVLLAAIVAGRSQLTPVAALPTTALERVAVAPQPEAEPVTIAAILPREAVAEPPARAPEIAPAAVVAKPTATKRAKKQTRAKKHRKKSRSSKRKHSRATAPSKRIGVTSSSDPLAGV